MRVNRVTLTGTTRWFGLALICVGVASCSASTDKKRSSPRSKEYFAESIYGVKASPRVASGANVPKGGGRYMVGKPYQVQGKTYVPKDNPGYDKTGLASWYGSAFHGRKTANGEVYDQYHISAAHPTMPLPSYARVTNLDNGTSVIVRVNDRGPFHAGRIIDVSEKGAELLDLKQTGTARVRVQYVGPARMDGHDMPYLMASYTPKGSRLPQISPDMPGAQGVMVASSAPVPMPAGLPFEAEAPLPATVSASAFGATPVAGAGATAFEQFAILPQTGPQLIPRPFQAPGGSLILGNQVSAYVEPETGMTVTAFDAILMRDDALTPQAIRAFAAKQTAGQD